LKYLITYRIFILCCLLKVSGVSAQHVTATVDREKILIGEQLVLELKLEDVNTRQFRVAQLFNLPDSFNHLEIVNRSAIDTINIGGDFTYVQKFTITGFDSGSWKIPALTIQLDAINTGPGKKITTPPIGIEVVPVDVSEMKDYHPIKDILEVKPISNWWIWVLIGLGAILLLLIIYWLYKKFKRRPKKINQSAYPPLQEALNGLAKLKKENSEQQLSNKAFYFELENIYRNYFQRKLNFNALQSTPDELILRLKINLHNNEHGIQFFQLVRLIAAVKYAKFQPSNSERTNSIDLTANTLQFIDQSQGGNA
jgi:hypothetical protein